MIEFCDSATGLRRGHRLTGVKRLPIFPTAAVASTFAKATADRAPIPIGLRPAGENNFPFPTAATGLHRGHCLVPPMVAAAQAALNKTLKFRWPLKMPVYGKCRAMRKQQLGTLQCSHQMQVALPPYAPGVGLLNSYLFQQGGRASWRPAMAMAPWPKN